MQIEDLLKVGKSKKYCSKIVHLKLGNALLIRTDTAENRYKEIEKGNSKERTSFVLNEVSHLKKMLTTDRRVLEIEDFPDINEKILNLQYFIPETSFSFLDQNPNITTNKDEFEEVLRNVLTISPFRLRLEIKSISKEDDLVHIIYPDGEITPECWVYWNGGIYLAYTSFIRTANFSMLALSGLARCMSI